MATATRVHDYNCQLLCARTCSSGNFPSAWAAIGLLMQSVDTAVVAVAIFGRGSTIMIETRPAQPRSLHGPHRHVLPLLQHDVSPHGCHPGGSMASAPLVLDGLDELLPAVHDSWPL